MDKKNLVKTLINVLPIFLVPLVLERKRINEQPDVKKATDATVKASKTVAHKSVQFKDAVVDKSGDAKDYVVEKKQHLDEKRQLKQIAKESDPAYIEKQEEKAAQERRKEAEKLDKKLQKRIEKRHKEEEKLRAANQSERIKSIKKANKYMDEVGLSPGKVDKETEKKGDKLAKENRKEISKLDKILQKRIAKRHKEEEKELEKNKKARLAEFKKYKNYDAKSVVKQNKEQDE
ncbi:hypothetical protein [Staphylococcus kloosii]|uniref:hypothetical protein n=1 Tax=Staphylococcus kloosii TaxID=29384 RepID=UPI0028A4C563|nr:hypothetical protein [Staphylococcus kloosii]MDT3958303.1 hypothetical protein [Staphylococcus kloosii]